MQKDNASETCGYLQRIILWLPALQLFIAEEALGHIRTVVGGFVDEASFGHLESIIAHRTSGFAILILRCYIHRLLKTVKLEYRVFVFERFTT